MTSISLSCTLKPKHITYCKNKPKLHPIAISVTERTGIMARVEKDKLLMFKDEDLANPTATLSMPTLYDNPSTSTSIFKIDIPRSHVPIYAQRGDCVFTPTFCEFLFKLNGDTHPSFYLHKPLAEPIVTSDGISYKSVANYYHAMKTTSFSMREQIAKTDVASLGSFWTGRDRHIRSDWGILYEEVLYRALKHRYDTDESAKAFLLGTALYPIIYYTHNTKLGVDYVNFKGDNILGRVNMKLRHEYIFDQGKGSPLLKENTSRVRVRV